MPDLRFQVEEASATANAAAPQISFKVRITNGDAKPVHSIALRVQVQIDPVRRRYTAAEQKALAELFGEPERWSQTLHPLLWADVGVTVPAFTDQVVVEAPVPCTFDFNVAVTKYIHGLKNGDLPLTMFFSGTMFYAGAQGVQVAQIPWDREAAYRLPIGVWKEMIDRYYPGTAWLCLRRDVVEKLDQFRSRHGLPTWEQAIERMLGLTAGVEQ